MKSILQMSLLMVGLVIAAQLDAQLNDYKTTLKISPIQFGKSYFELGLEFGLNEGRSSIQISPMALLKKDNYEEFTGIQAEIQYRSYLLRLDKEEAKTWIFSDIDMFAGAYALGMNFSRDYMTYAFNPTGPQDQVTATQDIFAVEGGVVIGIKFTMGERVTLDLLAGGGVRYSDIEDSLPDGFNPENFYFRDNSDVFDPGYYGVKPKLNLQLGITL